jgi:hypothetical protein
VLLKDLPNPLRPNRTYMSEKSFLKGVQCLSGLHEGLVLLKDLPNPLRPNRTYMSEKSFLKNIGKFTMPHRAYTKG